MTEDAATFPQVGLEHTVPHIQILVLELSQYIPNTECNMAVTSHKLVDKFFLKSQMKGAV